MNADGSDLRQLTHGIQFTSVDWSPDGTDLLVTAQRLRADGRRFGYDLALVTSTGRSVQELTHDGRSTD